MIFNSAKELCLLHETISKFKQLNSDFSPSVFICTDFFVQDVNRAITSRVTPSGNFVSM